VYEDVGVVVVLSDEVEVFFSVELFYRILCYVVFFRGCIVIDIVLVSIFWVRGEKVM